MNTDDILKVICACAKKNLARCASAGEDFQTVGFIIKDGSVDIDNDILSLLYTDEGKDPSFKDLGMRCAKSGSHQVVYVLDSVYRKILDEKSLDYIKENWDTERPSVYPESMRKQMLFVHLVDFKGCDVRIGLGYDIVNGKVIFEDDILFTELSGSERKSISIGFVAGKMSESGVVQDTGEFMKSLSVEYPNLTGGKNG